VALEMAQNAAQAMQAFHQENGLASRANRGAANRRRFLVHWRGRQASSRGKELRVLD
jgi:hypothetical protein